MKQDDMKSFIINNSYWIFQYINAEIFKDIGKINPNYFVSIMKDTLNEYNRDINLLPYLLLTQISGKGKIDYTSLRIDTIDFKQIDKEASVYYNYAQFTLEDNLFCIDLMQTKIGGMPIDKDIVKFTKKVPIQEDGLENFINKNKESEKDPELISILLQLNTTQNINN